VRRCTPHWRASSLALLSLLVLGAECGDPKSRCIDFRGRTIEFQLAAPGECVAECGDFEISFPDTMRVFVTDEVGYRREWACETPRVDLLSPFPGLSIDRPSFEDTGLWLSEGNQMTIGERVTLEANGCTGRLYGNLSTFPFSTGPDDPEAWLEPSPEPNWDMNFIFYPDDPFACGLPELCGTSFCRAYGEAVD